VRRPDLTPEALPDAGVTVLPEPLERASEDIGFDDAVGIDDDL
jgi:hypothetical protein